MNKVPPSDEEDDLEILRLAALQSLKRKNEFESSSGFYKPNAELSSNFKNKRNKWKRFGSQQRPGKTGNFPRTRNTNLISITPVITESDEKNTNNDQEKKSNVTKDIKVENINVEGAGCSKFSRYNKSDKSESESELDEDSVINLKKSDSLEALMQELDEGIQGPVKPDQVDETSKKSVKTQNVESEEINKNDNSITENTYQNSIKTVVNKSTEDVVSTKTNERKTPFRKQPHGKPYNKFTSKKHRNFPNIPPPHQQMFNNYQPPIIPFINPPMFIPTANPHLPPMYFERPPSPLTLNTESLATATMAPLSPRSAAFVLENKAIIERRKRSPRRSYSRSRSRSLSRSPRYSPSPPRRFRRSISPRRSPPRRFSPRRRSLSPKRRSISPQKDTNKSISHKVVATVDNKTKENNQPKNKDVKTVPEQESDPVLEARRRKFETNEIKKREGIIRLKPKDVSPKPKEISTKPKEVSLKPKEVIPKPKESSPKPKETSPKPQEIKPNNVEIKDIKSEGKNDIPTTGIKIKEKENKAAAAVPVPKGEEKSDPIEFQELEKLLFNDDAALDDIEIDPKVADIFSDEDSASDNEGRFKMKEKQEKNVPVLSFTKLINGKKEEIKLEALPSSSRSHESRIKSGSSKYQPRKPPIDHYSKRQRITVNNEKITPAEKKAENKIQIKIRNPLKYEKKRNDEIVSFKSKKVITFSEDEVENDVSEITVVKDEGEENMSSGDLRTQLSKKRAEKLQSLPAEEVSSRILKFALQGAVFKKSKKKSKKNKSLISETKLPIHLRLGLNNVEDMFEEVKLKKKSKKRKARELLEQLREKARAIQILKKSTKNRESGTLSRSK